MRPGGKSSVADISDVASLVHRLANPDTDSGKMAVAGNVLAVVPDLHAVAIAAFPSGVDHRPFADAGNAGPVRSRVIGAVMRSPDPKDGMKPALAPVGRDTE